MNALHQLIDFILHIDKHLEGIIDEYRALTYLILFVIIFCETGLVVTPFLPGDSLLFAAGALAVHEGNGLNVHLMAVLLMAAAFLGNMVNYSIGRFIGPKVFEKDYRFIRRDYLLRTHEFFEKHGGKTVIITRFAPILRTFAPFVAGVGYMTYARFILFNLIGGFLWVFSFLYAGFFFGNVPVVKNNFSVVVIAIIVISLLPAFYAAIKTRFPGKHG